MWNWGGKGREEGNPGFVWEELADQRFLFMLVIPVIGGIVVFYSTGC